MDTGWINLVLPANRIPENVTVGVAAASMTLASMISSISIFAIQRVRDGDPTDRKLDAKSIDDVRVVAVVACCIIGSANLFVNGIAMLSSAVVLHESAGRVVPVGLASLSFSVTMISLALGRFLVSASIRALGNLAYGVRDDVPIYYFISQFGHRKLWTRILAFFAYFSLSAAIVLLFSVWFGVSSAILYVVYIFAPTILAVVALYCVLNMFGFYALGDRVKKTSAILYLVHDGDGSILMRRSGAYRFRKRVFELLVSRYSHRWDNYLTLPRYEHGSGMDERVAILKGEEYIKGRIGREIFGMDVDIFEGKGQEINRYFDSIGVDGCEKVLALQYICDRTIDESWLGRANEKSRMIIVGSGGYDWIGVDSMGEDHAIPDHVKELVMYLNGNSPQGGMVYWDIRTCG